MPGVEIFDRHFAVVLDRRSGKQSNPVKNLPLMLNAGQWRTDKRLGRLIA